MPVLPAVIGAGASIIGSAISKPKSAKDPNAYLAPYLRQGATGAQDLYESGGPSLWDGPTVAGPGAATTAALDAQIARGQNGSPLIDQAQSYVQSGLQQPITSQYGSAQNPYAQSVGGGSPFNPYSRSVGGGAQFDPYARAVNPGSDTNPYAASVGGGAQGNPYGSGANPFGQGQNPGLDAAFDYAAQKTQNATASEFARAGRNIGASAPVRADILSNLAAQIYAPAYESERNRELQYGQQQLGIGATGFENAQSRNQNAALQGQQIGAQTFDNAQSRGLQSGLAAQQIGSQGFQAGQARNLQAGLAGQNIGAQSFNDAQNRGLTANLAAQGIGAQGFENSQSRQLQDVNAQRQQQLGMLGFATPLAAQDYMDLQAQRDAGGQYDQFAQQQLSDQVNQFNQQQNAPGANLDALLARLNGLKSATGPAMAPTQQPNYIAAGLGGALAANELFPGAPKNTGYQANQDEIAQGRALGLWG